MAGGTLERERGSDACIGRDPASPAGAPEFWEYTSTIGGPLGHQPSGHSRDALPAPIRPGTVPGFTGRTGRSRDVAAGGDSAETRTRSRFPFISATFAE